MAYDQLDIHSINRASGVYRLHLNFDGNPKWVSTGSKASIPAQACLMTMGTFSSSRITEDLENALGTLNIELSDHPELVYSHGTGNIIRECFETARENNYLVHAVLARYSNESTPIFQEFIFSGTVDPREVSIAHRFIPVTGRRTETISCEFTPAKRLDTLLSVITPELWSPLVELTVRPLWLCIVDEPGVVSTLKEASPMPNQVTTLVTTGDIDLTHVAPINRVVHAGDPKNLTKDLAYGSHPRSKNQDIDKLTDSAGNGSSVPSLIGGSYPSGNWVIKLSVAINTIFEACDIKWDGVFPDGLNFRYAHFENGTETYEDDGEINPSLAFLSWNYVFGFNPFDGTSFKGPCTFDAELACRDFLKGIAAQLKCRIDVYDYDSDGLPITRFVAVGQTFGAFPDLEKLPESSEDTFITDKDGVRITRRGCKGSVLAPANSRSPVEIEIPFAPYAIGYETAPAFDASRLTPNPSLPFEDQWKCGQRGAVGGYGDGADQTKYPLNPDGWFVGTHLFRFDSSEDINQFPNSHNFTPGNWDEDNEDFYKATRWQGYYPIHAIYEVDRGELTNDQIKDRQKNYLISYALAFGRYLRGERRRLTQQFKGCVAPNWTDIANGQTYNFKPIDTDVEYLSVQIERDILEDVITVHFEESSPSTLPLTYLVESDMSGSGSIGGTSSSGGGGGGSTSQITTAGRFQCEWDTVNKKFINFTWQGSTPNYAPAIAGVNNSTDIILTFDPQFLKTSISTDGYFLYANSDLHIFGNALDVQWGLNAAKNDLINTNEIRLTWWKNDWANAANQKHISQTSFQDVINQMNRYPHMLWIVEYRGTL